MKQLEMSPSRRDFSVAWTQEKAAAPAATTGARIRNDKHVTITNATRQENHHMACHDGRTGSGSATHVYVTSMLEPFTSERRTEDLDKDMMMRAHVFADHERRHVLLHEMDTVMMSVPRASAALRKNMHNSVPRERLQVYTVRRWCHIEPWHPEQIHTLVCI
jgi:hypothetical protein